MSGPAETRIYDRWSDLKGGVLKRFADLFVAAYELITKKQRSARSIQELLFALQLFKEGKLEGAILADPNNTISLAAQRREEFRKRLATEGHDLLWRGLLESLSGGARNRLKEQRIDSLRKLVSRHDPTDDWCNFSQVGVKTVNQIEELLSAFGLYLNMTNEEVEKIFGPAST